MNRNYHIEFLRETIEPLRQEIIHHKVYSAIRDVEDLRIFMQYHVYAVWDFMSLLKSLQNNLTCTSIPWYPKGTADARYLINEIVVGEESDVDLEGNRKSHFEIYLDAMRQCGANTAPIESFLAEMKFRGRLDTAYKVSHTPQAASEFVDYTFSIIFSNKAYLQAAIFTFGREDLIPNMFLSIVNDMHRTFPNSIDKFKYYLDRHIEVDGDHHSHLALEMTAQLCGDNLVYWDDATNAIIESLQKRIALWDGVYDSIMQRKKIALN